MKLPTVQILGIVMLISGLYLAYQGYDIVFIQTTLFKNEGFFSLLYAVPLVLFGSLFVLHNRLK